MRLRLMNLARFAKLAAIRMHRTQQQDVHIIDTGLTLNYLLRYLRGKNPRSLRICALLDKPARRLVEIPIDYTGFTIPDEFVVGYGLDFGEFYRNLPFIGVLRRELYETS